MVLRAVAPTQLAAAVMLAAGATVALSAPTRTGVPLLIMCALAAVGTVAAGCWQGARYAVRRNHTPPAATGCQGSCAACTLGCNLGERSDGK
jgi:hypothetical protein